jgi:CheY-like chemotaxis protein
LEARNRDLVAYAVYGICRISSGGTFLDPKSRTIADSRLHQLLQAETRQLCPGSGPVPGTSHAEVELDEAYCRFYPYLNLTAGHYAVISVADTGIGMEVQTRERIFEPFLTTKERGKGTGLGLATVYGIVKQHEGFIHVYCEPAHGSLFRAYLPVIEGTVAGAASKASTPSMAEMRGTETVLIAEDHESVREMARQTLVGLGYCVLSASDGEEALWLCEDEKPALAILDVIMPRLGGPGAAAKLSERFVDLRVLFTSGYSAESEGFPTGRNGDTCKNRTARRRWRDWYGRSGRARSRVGIHARFGIVRTAGNTPLQSPRTLDLYHQAGWSQARSSRDKLRADRGGPTLVQAQRGGPEVPVFRAKRRQDTGQQDGGAERD